VEGVRAATSASAIVVISVGQLLFAQERAEWKIDRICGRVESVQQIKDRHQSAAISEKRKAIPGVPIDLYESREGSVCCVASDRRDTSTSDRRGQFRLRPPPGRDWLNLKWNGKDYIVFFIFERQAKSNTSCVEQGIQLEENGTATWWRTVTLD
jgi:hypothetical protein